MLIGQFKFPARQPYARNVDMSTCSREAALFDLYERVLMCCELELGFFAVKKSKNRLVCKNAVVLAYYGSCRFLVMGSWYVKDNPILMRSHI